MKTWFLVVWLFSGFAFGHDLWLEDTQAGSFVRYGHSGATHRGEKYLPYTASAVKSAQCFVDHAFQPLSISTATPIQISQDCDVRWVVFSTGFWSKTPQGTLNQSRNELSAVYQSWLSQESVKQIVRWQDEQLKPITDEFELIAEENPLLLAVGDKLRLRVFDHGLPVANVVVAYFGEPRGVTDEQGRINIRIQHSGLQLIQASKTEPYRDKTQADQFIQTTALQVTIP